MCPPSPVFGGSITSISTGGGRLNPRHYYVPSRFSDLPTALQIALGLNCLEPISLVGCQTDFQGNWSWQRGNTFHLHSGLAKFILITEFRTY